MLRSNPVGQSGDLGCPGLVPPVMGLPFPWVRPTPVGLPDLGIVLRAVRLPETTPLPSTSVSIECNVVEAVGLAVVKVPLFSYSAVFWLAKLKYQELKNGLPVVVPSSLKMPVWMFSPQQDSTMSPETGRDVH